MALKTIDNKRITKAWKNGKFSLIITFFHPKIPAKSRLFSHFDREKVVF